MPLQFAFTDPRTGFVFDAAYLVIDDARVHLAAQQAVLGISIYASASLATSGRGPITTDPDLYLTPAEIQMLQAAFTQQLYAILTARPEYAGAQIVQ